MMDCLSLLLLADGIWENRHFVILLWEERASSYILETSVMVNEDAVGNASLQDAVSWLFEHESGADIDQMPLVWFIHL